jgi:hypothetical protein
MIVSVQVSVWIEPTVTITQDLRQAAVRGQGNDREARPARDHRCRRRAAA